MEFDSEKENNDKESNRPAFFEIYDLKRAYVKLPPYGKDDSTTLQDRLNRHVHDGDTVNVIASGYFNIRFLGADTAEVSIDYPEGLKPKGLPRYYKWPRTEEHNEYLKDPFAYNSSDKFRKSLGEDLFNHLQKKLTSKTALNHQRHADKAAEFLRKRIKDDIQKHQSTHNSIKFRFFLAFAHEIMDRYGRFLGYIDREKSKEELEKDDLTYNEIMLRKGLASPYFIWPNINPFRGIESLTKAVYPPNKFKEKINEDNKLSRARKFVRDARKKQIGIFEENDPLKVLPFELRYLFRRKAPDRYVIDMSTSSSDPTLLKPTEYWRISNEEDRLFVDEHFVPLFKEKGYRIQE